MRNNFEIFFPLLQGEESVKIFSPTLGIVPPEEGAYKVFGDDQ